MFSFGHVRLANWDRLLEIQVRRSGKTYINLQPEHLPTEVSKRILNLSEDFSQQIKGYNHALKLFHIFISDVKEDSACSTQKLNVWKIKLGRRKQTREDPARPE